MVQKIALLPEQVINQIAAGEVLEHPASAVKEMVENSLDAGALRIEIEIAGGGHHLIRIEDDGAGMSRADAIACLQRHATSKIRETDDLLTLATLGFRGEALAAIASVSQLEIQTFDGEESTCLKAEGGRIHVEPCARNRGTTIDVRSLFYNVPARQKFQKSASSSAAQVLRTLQTISLAHPEVSFVLRAQERIVFQADADPDWRRRAREIHGSLTLEASFSMGDYSARGLIGSPEEAKGNRSGQYLFLNRRPIFSPLAARAVKDGYATCLAESQYPSFVLFLELPPDEFDVNVHPQKKDVRFRNESKVYRLVEQAISRALQPASSVEFSAPPQFTQEDPKPQPWSFREEPSWMETQPTFLPPPKHRRTVALIGSFSLIEGETYSWLDLKGAEARILFESSQKKGGASQALIWPLEIELSSEEALHGEEWASELQQMGIEARFLGGKMLAIDALPTGLEASDVPEFFTRYKIDRKAASSICRYCRSRKKMYSLEEAALIERRLAECADSAYDPLGRPITREIKEEDLTRWLSGP